MKNTVKENLMLKGLSEFHANIGLFVTMGLSNAEAANQMFISEQDVKTHLYNIYAFMGLKSRAQLIVYCLQWLPELYPEYQGQ